MASKTAAAPGIVAGGEVKVIGLVSAAHFFGHLHMLVVPPGSCEKAIAAADLLRRRSRTAGAAVAK
jgi:hypothetical protein